MNVKELLKEAIRIINRPYLKDDDRNRLKDILCFLSEWRANNKSDAEKYPQLNFVLYNASRKLRTFGYNRLNNLTNESINAGDELAFLKDTAVDELYRTESGFVLDKLQKEVIDEFENAHQRLFLSAPTSFGKTFLLKEIIYRHRAEYSNIIIVLPTVALLMEVTNEIEEFNNRWDLNYCLYNSIYRDLELTERNLFILTPERVLRLLAIYPDIKIDFFFFDEIYKIDEDVAIKSEDDISEKIELGEEVKADQDNLEERQDHRATAFRLVLYFLLKRCKACYLAGPFIELKGLKDGFVRMLKMHDIVAKEITFTPTLKNEISFCGRQYIFKSSFANFSRSTQAKTSIEKLTYVAKELKFSRNNQAIVYCLYPAYTEKYAKLYSEYFDSISSQSRELQLFIDHLKQNYNFTVKDGSESLENWDFLNALQNQVGVHNGKFPKYFQREIMRLFNDGAMSTLFCTSTIVEGVNTNAKTVVVYNNPSGKTPEGKRFLLLNINGRAGRYLHHFIGNIVLINFNTLKIIDCAGISLDFKPYNPALSISKIDLENINDDDLSNENRQRKVQLNFDTELLPDSVFMQNRLIERKKQERILKCILKYINDFRDIETASIEKFLTDGYFDRILKIWAEVGEIKQTQVDAIKYFSIKYANESYQGVLKYQFARNPTRDVHKFVNDSYRKVFKNVKDTIEYQLPRIISLFESLIIRAFEIESIHTQRGIDLSSIIRFFEIGASTPLGVDMAEKGVPIVTVKKIDKLKWGTDDLNGQRYRLRKRGSRLGASFDRYEVLHIQEYIDKYCKFEK